MIRIVTTFSRKQWDDYVQRLLPKSIELWPKEVEWQVWLDDRNAFPATYPLSSHSAPNWMYLSDDPEHEAFMAAWRARVASDPKLQANLTKFRYPYGYTKDAGTFAHKVFAFTHPAAREGCDWLIFLDADIETHQPVTQDWLDGVLTGDIVHLGRTDMRSSDTAFLAVHHPERIGDWCYGPSFLAALRAIYTSGDLFDWAEYIDGHIVERLCAVFAGMGAEVKNLSAGLPGLDVFERTVLGERMRHWKGQRGKAMLKEKLKA